jgi:hypothetical protein
MSTYFALGVEGVADQNKAEAVVYRMDSALSGFKPTVSRMQAVLEQVTRATRHGGHADAPGAYTYGRRMDYGGHPEYERRGGPPRAYRRPGGDSRPGYEVRP